MIMRIENKAWHSATNSKMCLFSGKVLQRSSCLGSLKCLTQQSALELQVKNDLHVLSF